MDQIWIIGTLITLLIAVVSFAVGLHIRWDNQNFKRIDAEILRLREDKQAETELSELNKEFYKLKDDLFKNYALVRYVDEVDMGHIKRWHDFKDTDWREINKMLVKIRVKLQINNGEK